MHRGCIRTEVEEFAIYLGERALKDGPIAVLPTDAFLRELAAGRILRPPTRRR